MPNLDLKQKIMIIIAIVGTILILIFQRGFAPSDNQVDPVTQEVKNEAVSSEPKVISTIPSPLEEAIVLPSQAVEITFNLALENVGEFKYRIEPKPEHKIELSNDRKTVKIIPVKPFPLGSTYTLFITSAETKFDGKKRLSGDITYHFKTVEYHGI